MAKARTHTQILVILPLQRREDEVHAFEDVHLRVMMEMSHEFQNSEVLLCRCRPPRYYRSIENIRLLPASPETDNMPIPNE